MGKDPTAAVTRVEAKTVEQLTIHSVGLDPIRVVIEQFGEGEQGMITITCYGRAWTAFWGAMATRSVRKFFVSCDVPYLVGCLVRGTTPTAKRFVASDEAYLARIVVAVQQVFRTTTPATDNSENKRLRGALAALVGSGDVAELRAMELAVRQLPASDEDRAVTINAIHVLIATAPAPTDKAEVPHG